MERGKDAGGMGCVHATTSGEGEEEAAEEAMDSGASCTIRGVPLDRLVAAYTPCSHAASTEVSTSEEAAAPAAAGGRQASTGPTRALPSGKNCGVAAPLLAPLAATPKASSRASSSAAAKASGPAVAASRVARPGESVGSRAAGLCEE